THDVILEGPRTDVGLSAGTVGSLGPAGGELQRLARVDNEMGGPAALEDYGRMQLQGGGNGGRELSCSLTLDQDVDFMNLRFSVSAEQAVAHITADHQCTGGAALGVLPRGGSTPRPL